MQKYYLLVILALLISSPVLSQRKLKKQLDTISTTDQAEAFIKQSTRSTGKIMTFNEEKHKTRLAKEILKMGKGGSKVIRNEIENVHYKVLEKNKREYFRVSYILLDGRKMPVSEIESLRPKLINAINSGTPIKELANRFSMDMNAKRGGDSGWITYGDVLPEFEQQVMNDAYAVEDVFTVDVESNQWYYVVQKTHDKKSITEVKVLRVVESKK